MDYTRFSFRAVVDWLEIAITTVAPTNAPTIRRKGALCYVTPIDAGAGGAATRFCFRIYDPDSWAGIRGIIAEIEQATPFAMPPTVTGMEISFDAYSNGATLNELAALAADFCRFNTAAISNNRRIAGRWRGDTEGLPGQAYARRKVAAGRVIAIGDKTAPISQRIYFKTTDHNGQSIPDADYRARIEVTLQGKALPMTTLDDGEGYSFEGLAAFFKFRALKDGLDPTAKAAAEYPARIGERGERKRREGGTRLYAKGTRADTPLNRKAYDALRELSRRMAKP
jgi:hypothetical protein